MNKTSIDKIKKVFSGYEEIGEHGTNHFAVLIPIVLHDDQTYLAYEVRAAALNRQPGEVCFPGGLIEKGENPRICALRETEEELGIKEKDIEIIAKLDSIFTTSGSQIHCFVGIIDGNAFKKLKMSEAEVDEVFLVSIDSLLDKTPEMYYSAIMQEPDPDFPYYKITSGQKYPWRGGRVPVPVYETKALGWKANSNIDYSCATEQNMIIWGLTGRMTKQFLEVLQCSN